MGYVGQKFRMNFDTLSNLETVVLSGDPNLLHEPCALQRWKFYNTERVNNCVET